MLIMHVDNVLGWILHHHYIGLMQEILDRYSSSSAFPAQSLSSKDNHLYAKIALFACSRGHTFLVYNTPHYWLRNTDFVSHHSPACGRNCFKSCQNLLFYFWCVFAFRFEMANKPVFRSRRSTLQKVGWLGIQWIGNRCSHNLCVSHLFSFASLYVRCIPANSSYVYSAMAFTKGFGCCYQDNILSDDDVTFLKDKASSDWYKLKKYCCFFSLEICMWFLDSLRQGWQDLSTPKKSGWFFLDKST